MYNNVFIIDLCIYNVFFHALVVAVVFIFKSAVSNALSNGYYVQLPCPFMVNTTSQVNKPLAYILILNVHSKIWRLWKEMH